MALENGIIYSEPTTVNGVEGYMIQQEGEKEPTFCPTYQIEDGQIVAVLDPEKGIYFTEMEYTSNPEEQEMLKEPVGSFGMKWQKFMEENYSGDVEVMKVKCRWEIISRQVDNEAWEMYELLQKQYTEKNPRPTTTFVEIEKWQHTMDFYVRHEVMEQIVLKPRTV